MGLLWLVGEQVKFMLHFALIYTASATNCRWRPSTATAEQQDGGDKRASESLRWATMNLLG